MKRRITTGIDVGTQAVRVVISEWREGEKFPTVLGVGIAHSSGLRHGYVVQPEEAKASILKAVHDAERVAKIEVKNAVISIGGISLESMTTSASLSLSRTDNTITAQDLRLVESLAEKELPDIPNRKIILPVTIKYKLDGKDILGRAIGRQGNKLEVKMLFIYCQEQHFQDLVRAVEDTGIEVLDVIPSSIAASLVALEKRQKMVGCALVNIGAETMSVVVFENEVPISLHVFPIGGNEITNDIALGLKVPIDEAENIKLGIVDTGFSKRKLEEIIESRLAEIFELVDSQLKKINRSGLLPGGAFITGGSTYFTSIEEVAKKVLRIPVSISHADINNISKGRLRDSTWAVAYGLTLFSDSTSYSETNKFSDMTKHFKRKVKHFFEQLLP